jgi:hypothetical protein
MKFITCFLNVFFILSSIEISAQWTSNPVLNTSISSATGNQAVRGVISDGSGGEIFVWTDERSGTRDIYVQKTNSSGVVQWTTNGLAVCTASNAQQNPTLTSDGLGGAIIAWEDSRNGTTQKIYAQRVDANGAILWATNGVLISANSQGIAPKIASDNAGGAVITWVDFVISSPSNIYAQRVNSLGVLQWNINGVSVCSALDSQSWPEIIADGIGGAIIVWSDVRAGISELYAQRINSAGAPLWANNGIPVCTNSICQGQKIISDSNNGAYITWQDDRNGLTDVYIQHLNSFGIPQWTANGINTTPIAIGIQDAPVITNDGSGGVIVCWKDSRSGDYDIYAQKFNSLGIEQWITNGVAICTATLTQDSPAIVYDELGGAIITWSNPNTTNANIFAQRVNSLGVVQWATNGVLVSSAANFQEYPLITSNDLGGAVLTWRNDLRNGSGNNDIYAQNICSSGLLGVNPLSLTGNISGQDTICEGMNITYSISPVLGASYNWVLPDGWTGLVSSNSITVTSNSFNGSIKVIVTNSNCAAFSYSKKIIVNTLPNLSSIYGSSTICNGISYSYSITPINNSVVYSWNYPIGWTGSSTSNSISIIPNSNSGNIFLVVNNACGSSTVTQAVNVNPSPTITANSGVICAGDSFTIIPSGALTYTYSGGSNIVTPMSNMSYSVNGTDSNGCISAIEAVSNIIVNALPNILAVTSNTLLCVGQSATLSATGAITYTWSTTENGTNIMISPTIQSSYTVQGTDGNGCNNSATVTQNVSLCTGLNSINNNSLFNVYPNPNLGLFEIELLTEAKVVIANSLGQIIISEMLLIGNNTINIQNQSAGIYFVKVIQNGKQQVIKLIKEQ